MINNVKLIGTSHISSKSVKVIKNAFLEPIDFVCIELDPGRFATLISKDKRIRLSNIKHLGVRAFALGLVGHYVQQKLGKMVGIEPGSDMLTAVKYAAKNNAKIFFIDREIKITLKKVTKIPLREKMRFFWDIISSPFAKKKVKIDLKGVPSDKIIEEVMGLLRKRYPSVFKVLVTERNRIMAKRVLALNKKFPDKKILVVVGAGHEKGMKAIFEAN